MSIVDNFFENIIGTHSLNIYCIVYSFSPIFLKILFLFQFQRPNVLRPPRSTFRSSNRFMLIIWLQLKIKEIII